MNQEILVFTVKTAVVEVVVGIVVAQEAAVVILQVAVVAQEELVGGEIQVEMMMIRRISLSGICLVKKTMQQKRQEKRKEQNKMMKKKVTQEKKRWRWIMFPLQMQLASRCSCLVKSITQNSVIALVKGSLQPQVGR